MRAVVTGGAGFIGSHLVDALVAAGHEVTVLDHLAQGHEGNLGPALRAGARLVRADVTDVAATCRAVCAARPAVVFHLAAQIDVRRSVDDPSTDAHVNVGGTASVLEAARRAGARRVVLSSTAGVYGEPAELPTSEASPVAPLSPYCAGKAAAESYLRLYARLHGLSAVALRVANVYGPRQDPFGEAGIAPLLPRRRPRRGRARLARADDAVRGTRRDGGGLPRAGAGVHDARPWPLRRSSPTRPR